MALQSSFYVPDGSTRTFPTTKHIATKQHVAVYFQSVADSTWSIVAVDLYSLVNNSIVFDDAPDAVLYSQIEIRVADSADELEDSPSDIAIVAGAVADIATVSGSIADVETVSTNIGAVQTVSANDANVTTAATNIASVNTVSANIDKVNTVAGQDANITAIADQVVPNMTEILQADDNAATATAQASEATTQATTATTQASIATTKAGEATASATEAEHWANYPTDQAVPEGAGEFSAKHYATKAQTYATQTSSKTSVRNTVTSSSAALALSTTPTQSLAIPTWTGNGTTQDIVTGLPSVDANWSASGRSTTLGSEKVTNGTFDTDTTGWTDNAGTIVWNASTADVTRSGGVGEVGYQNITLDQTGTHNISFDLVWSGSGLGDGIRVYDGSFGALGSILTTITDTTNTTKSGQFTATSTSICVVFIVDADTQTANFDNISIKAEVPTYDVGDYVIEDYVIYENLTGAVGTSPLSADTTNWSAVADGVSVDFPNMSLDIKCRSNVTNHTTQDTLRGAGKTLSSNLTDAESTGFITSFNSDGFTVNVTGGNSSNNSGYTYVAHCRYYDSMVSGVSDGKRYVAAYNAQSGEGMMIYEGSGNADRVYPNQLGTQIDFIAFKNRTTGATNWMTTRGDFSTGAYLNTNGAEYALTGYTNSDASFTTDNSNLVNASANHYVAYFSSSRVGHTIVDKYIGTGAAGNVIDVGFDLTTESALVEFKAIGETGSWGRIDTVRGEDNYLLADLSNAEATFDIYDFTTTGLVTKGTSNNTAGVEYLVRVTIFNYDKPNGGITTTTPTVTYAKGVDADTGDINTVETLTAQDFTLTSGATNYLYVDEGDTLHTSIYPMLYTDSYASPDANSDTYDIVGGVVHQASTGTAIARIPLGECYVDGTGEAVPDTLIEYPHRKQYATGAVFTDDVEFGGGVDFGQQWVDVTSERLDGVTYKNETGKPIQVNMNTLTHATAGNANISIDGNVVTNVYCSSADNRTSVSFTVPNGSTYSFANVSNSSINKWTELR